VIIYGFKKTDPSDPSKCSVDTTHPDASKVNPNCRDPAVFTAAYQNQDELRNWADMCNVKTSIPEDPSFYGKNRCYVPTDQGIYNVTTYKRKQGDATQRLCERKTDNVAANFTAGYNTYSALSGWAQSQSVPLDKVSAEPATSCLRFTNKGIYSIRELKQNTATDDRRSCVKRSDGTTGGSFSLPYDDYTTLKSWTDAQNYNLDKVTLSSTPTSSASSGIPAAPTIDRVNGVGRPSDRPIDCVIRGVKVDPRNWYMDDASSNICYARINAATTKVNPGLNVTPCCPRANDGQHGCVMNFNVRGTTNVSQTPEEVYAWTDQCRVNVSPPKPFWTPETIMSTRLATPERQCMTLAKAMGLNDMVQITDPNYFDPDAVGFYGYDMKKDTAMQNIVGGCVASSNNTGFDPRRNSAEANYAAREKWTWDGQPFLPLYNDKVENAVSRGDLTMMTQKEVETFYSRSSGISRKHKCAYRAEVMHETGGSSIPQSTLKAFVDACMSNPPGVDMNKINDTEFYVNNPDYAWKFFERTKYAENPAIVDNILATGLRDGTVPPPQLNVTIPPFNPFACKPFDAEISGYYVNIMANDPKKCLWNGDTTVAPQCQGDANFDATFSNAATMNAWAKACNVSIGGEWPE
jgi:hypothetical protein